MKSSFDSIHDYHFQKKWLYCFDFVYKHEWWTWECNWKIVELLSRTRTSTQSTFWLRAVKFINCIGCVITFYSIGNQRKGVPLCIKWKLQIIIRYVQTLLLRYRCVINLTLITISYSKEELKVIGYSCQFSTCSSSKFASNINTFNCRN